MKLSEIFKKFRREKSYKNQNVDVCLFTYLMARPYIKKFRNAVDIGCRDGDFSRPMLNDFEKIYAFDYRDRLNFSSKKLEYFQYALGDNDSKVRASGGVITNLRNSKINFVQQKTLDSFNLKDIDFIKIDVEGHELKVLEGAKLLIAQYSPVFVIEENGSQILWGKGKENDAINYLLSLNYKIVAKNQPPLSQDYVLIRDES